jgi:predicted MFS family arabinose efflux permease
MTRTPAADTAAATRAAALAQAVHQRLQAAAGGTARLRALVLLAAVLSLTSADQATVGAMAGQLRSSLRIDNTDIGLLVTASGAVGLLTTLPFGWLADRVNRVRLLVISIGVWSIAMLASSAAQSFEALLTTRLALGAVVAAAGPVVASLVGDLFAPAERGRIYGAILTGELLGAGFGLLISGDIAALWTWRASFALLALLGFALAFASPRMLPEPPRDGRGCLLPSSAGPIPDQPIAAPTDQPERAGDPKAGSVTVLAAEVERAHITPRAGSSLNRAPGTATIWRTVRAVLCVPTNVVFIVASSLGYFFVGGLQTFAVVFAKARFGLNQGEASMLLLMIGGGAAVGLLLAGRISDVLIARHHVNARPSVAAACYLLAAVVFLPALLAAPLLFVAVAGLAGVNSPLDAGRLDVMPAHLRGQAESVRTMLRTALQSGAPLVFGWASTQLGGRGSSTGLGHPDSSQPDGALGLDHAFLIMLTPLLLAAALLWFAARRTYPRDVATALAASHPPGGAPR